MLGKKFVVAIVIFIIIAVGAITLLMTKSERFDTPQKTQSKAIDPANVVKVTVDVVGMTCTACEPTIHMMVKKIPGIVSVKASFEATNTVVEFDKTQTTVAEVVKAIEETGYKATAYEDATGKHALTTEKRTPKKVENAMKCGADMKCGANMKCGGGN